MTNKTTDRKTCADLVEDSFNSRMSDLKRLYSAEEQETKDLGSLYDYGLSIDAVEAGTFKDQREDYIRYQISYGGPSEEFRLYKNGDMEFWYLDWFDGVCVPVTGKNKEVIENIVLMDLPFNEAWDYLIKKQS